MCSSDDRASISRCFRCWQSMITIFYSLYFRHVLLTGDGRDAVPRDLLVASHPPPPGAAKLKPPLHPIFFYSGQLALAFSHLLF